MSDTTEEIRELVAKYLENPEAKEVLAADYGLVPAGQPVLRSILLSHPKLGRVKLVESTELARQAPEPFEWQVEITYLDIDEPYRHYLILNDDKLVRADRKDFFEVDKTEADQVISELKQLE